ncbi:MAG: hypothetical protein AAF845_04730 [Bacteroidota bacterium]
MVLAGAVVFAASGLAGCTASGPRSLPEAEPVPGPTEAGSILGEWASVDTLSQTFEVGDGEVIESQTLFVHLSISDSTWTETIVSSGSHGLGATPYTGRQATLAYRVSGDSVTVDYAPPVAPVRGTAIVREDTLTVEVRLERGETIRQRFVQSEPLRVPPALLGFWVGLSEPDAAGVPAELGFRFHADGTFENGWGEPEGTFVVAGPYLLMRNARGSGALSGETGDAETDALLASLFDRVAEMDLDPAFEAEPGVVVPALRLGAGGEAVVLFRRSP